MLEAFNHQGLEVLSPSYSENRSGRNANAISRKDYLNLK